MPGSFQASGFGGVPSTKGIPAVRGFLNGAMPIFGYPYSIAGVTRDSTGAVLGNCVVTLYRTADNSVAGSTTSDANGVFHLDASPLFAHYLVAYHAGSPDVAGTTVNVLVGS